jgi:hypothetical protein
MLIELNKGMLLALHLGRIRTVAGWLRSKCALES